MNYISGVKFMNLKLIEVVEDNDLRASVRMQEQIQMQSNDIRNFSEI